MPEGPHRYVCDRGGLCVDLVAEEQAVPGEKHDRVDLLLLQCPPPGGGRLDHPEAHRRVVERLRCALERGTQPSGAGAVTATR